MASPETLSLGATRKPIRRLVLCLGIGETLAWAATFYLFPALLPHWIAAEGWSISALSGAYSAALIASASAAPLAGRLIDRGYGRSILAGSTLVAGGLLAALSQVTSFTQFVAVWIGLGIAMAGALYEPCFAFLTYLLGGNAKRAITWVTLMAGFAGTIAFPGNHGLAVGLDLGWRGAALFFAAICVFVAAPLMWFSTKANPQPADRPDPAPTKARQGAVARAVRNPVFWLLSFAFAALMLHHSMLISHLLTLLAERGIAPEIAVLAAGGIGPMQVAGRLLMIAVERHVSMRIVCGISFILVLIAAIALNATGLYAGFIFVFVMLQGAGYGVTSIVRPVITAELLGRLSFGAISGLMAVPFLVAAALAPTSAALIWKLGGYDLLLKVCMALPLIGLSCYMCADFIRGRQAR